MFLKCDVAGMASDTDVDTLLGRALSQLIEGDFQTRWEAAKRLAAFGPDVIDYLIPLLADAELDWEARWFIARTLGEFDHEAALEALVQLLQKTTEPELIAIAAEGLSHFGKSGVEALIPLLDKPSHRLTMVQALARVRDSATFEPLLTLADDPDPTIRALVIPALANFKVPSVDALLLQAAKDPHVTVRQAAITYLGLRSHLLAQIDLVSLLMPGLWDLSPLVNKATAIALGRLNTEASVTSLAQVLSSPHTPETLQIEVVRALGWIEKNSALLTLLSARRQTSVAVQVEIINTLVRFRDPQLQHRAGEVLCSWLNTDLAAATGSAPVQQAIALALGQLNYAPALPLLTELRQGPNAQTRLYAEAALKQLEA